MGSRKTGLSAPLLERAVDSVSVSAFRKLSSIYVFSYFPFGFEGRIWDLIVSVPDHCLSFYFSSLLETQTDINFGLVKTCVKP